jgi:hypothetical protein
VGKKSMYDEVCDVIDSFKTRKDEDCVDEKVMVVVFDLNKRDRHFVNNASDVEVVGWLETHKASCTPNQSNVEDMNGRQ